MGRIGVTYEQFSEAANDVLLTGQFPTIEKVRLVLGVGSHTTLNAYMNRWKDEFIKNHLAGTKNTAIPDPVQRVVNEVWETIRTESKVETEQLQQNAQAAVQAAQEAQATAEQQVTALQWQVDKLRLDLNHAQADFKMLQDELIETRKSCAVAEERAQSSENKEKVIREETNKRLSELEQAQQEHSQQLEQQFKAREAQYKEENNYYKSALEEQRQKYAFEVDQLKTAKTKVEQTVNKQEIEIKHYKQQHQVFQEQLRALQFDLSLAQQRQQEAEKALTTQQIETHFKEKALSEWQQKFEMAKEETGALKQQVNLLQEKMNQPSKSITKERK